MTKALNFTDLRVWQEGNKPVITVYEATKTFPSEEKFSLTDQIRRSAVSVTSNIAEGFGRQSSKDKIHFYIMARGSLLELQDQLLIARDISILETGPFNKLGEQTIITHKLLNGLIRSINSVK